METFQIIYLILLVLSLLSFVVVGGVAYVFSRKCVITIKRIHIYILNIFFSETIRTLVSISIVGIEDSTYQNVVNSCLWLVPIYNILQTVGLFTLLQLSIEMMLCAKKPIIMAKFGSFIRPMFTMPTIWIYSSIMGTVFSVNYKEDWRNSGDKISLYCKFLQANSVSYAIVGVVVNHIIPSTLIIAIWSVFHRSIKKIEGEILDQITQEEVRLRNLKALKKIDRVGIITSLNYIIFMSPQQFVKLGHYIYLKTLNLTQVDQIQHTRIKWLEFLVAYLTTFVLPINLLIFISLIPQLAEKFRRIPHL